jgi:hypothetical protein
MKVKNPGPGEYNYNSSIGKGLKYSMGNKQEVKLNLNSPGPGSYNHETKDNVKLKNPAWK